MGLWLFIRNGDLFFSFVCLAFEFRAHVASVKNRWKPTRRKKRRWKDSTIDSISRWDARDLTCSRSLRDHPTVTILWRASLIGQVVFIHLISEEKRQNQPVNHGVLRWLLQYKWLFHEPSENQNNRARASQVARTLYRFSMTDLIELIIFQRKRRIWSFESQVC